jgi:hypothetical protein
MRVLNTKFEPNLSGQNTIDGGNDFNSRMSASLSAQNTKL